MCADISRYEARRSNSGFQLGHQFLVELCQLIHVGLLGRPADNEACLLVWLRDQVEVDVVYLLVGESAIVLQNVVVAVCVEVQCLGDLLGGWQHVV